MNWEDIRAEYEPLLNVTKNFPVPGWVRDNILNALKTEFENKIQSGQVSPPLAQSTVKRKIAKGSPNPEAPLFDTGEMSESLGAEENSYAKLVVASIGSKVSPNWHLDQEHLAPNNPLRTVLSDEEVLDIINKQIDNWLSGLSIEDVMALGLEVS